MDLTSPQIPYIMGAFIFAGGMITLLTFWTWRADRIASRELKNWKSDEAKI